MHEPDSLVREIVRKNNTFLIKQFGNDNGKTQFSKDPNNVYNVHC
jgi:large subunit ribosomal protein L28e